MSQAAAAPAAADPVFAAFCAAGLWPGLGKRTAAELPAVGITSADDVTAALADHDPADRVRIAWTDADGVGHTATVTLGASPVA